MPHRMHRIHRVMPMCTSIYHMVPWVPTPNESVCPSSGITIGLAVFQIPPNNRCAQQTHEHISQTTKRAVRVAIGRIYAMRRKT